MGGMAAARAATTIYDIAGSSHDCAYYLDAVQAHVIEEEQVYEITIVRQRANSVGCLNWHIIRLHGVLRDNDTNF